MNKLDIKKKFLVTGAAGFIGAFLCKRLLEEGCTVIGIDNMNDYYDISLKEDRLKMLGDFERFTFEKIDISDKKSLENIFKKTSIDIVINLAAQAGVRYSIENPDAYIQSNIVGFYNILECCRNYAISHLLFASSSSIYGNSNQVPFCVDDKTDKPISLYAATKKSDELLAYAYSHLYSIPMTGLRFFTVYGPMGRPDMAYFSFANNMVARKEIKIFNNGNLSRDFTYIDDIIESVVRLIENSKAVTKKSDEPFIVYNVGNSNPVNLLDFVNILERKMGKEAKKIYVPMQPGDVYTTYADVTQLQDDIQFVPQTSFEEGIGEFVKWYMNKYQY